MSDQKKPPRTVAAAIFGGKGNSIQRLNSRGFDSAVEIHGGEDNRASDITATAPFALEHFARGDFEQTRRALDLEPSLTLAEFKQCFEQFQQGNQSPEALRNTAIAQALGAGANLITIGNFFRAVASAGLQIYFG